MKKVCYLLLLVFMMLPCVVKAEIKYGYSNVTGSSFSIRQSASTKATTIGYLYAGTNVEIVGTASGDGCGTWYKINFNNGTGWVCGISTGGAHNVELYTTQTLRTNNRTASTAYEKELQAKGFPSSYWDKLTALHNSHPNWNFVADKTNRDWSYVTWAETGAVSDGDDDKSLLYAYNNDTSLIAGYLKTDNYNYKNNTFNMKDSGGFYAARQELVAYYMDPRNFLNENFIFQFEKLQYNSETHTKAVVENVFGSGYLRRYADKYVNAAKSENISPVQMATRSIQEGRNNQSYLTDGSSFTYKGSRYPSIYGQTFSNCYNFFNIGAYSDTVSAMQNGGVFACGGPNRNETSYARPWNTPDKAVLGGAKYLKEKFIGSGQDTIYYQKYNTSGYTKNTLYANQYMTYIAAVAYEGSDTYDAYYNAGLINKAYTFVIPTYNNMPEKTTLPSSLNPNNYLKSLKVNNTSVPSFDGAKTSGYKVNVANSTTSVKINAEAVVSGTSIDLNDKTVNLNVGDNNINVVVTAKNGEKRTYTVVVTREKGSDNNNNQTPSNVVESTDLKVKGTYLGNININNTGNTIRNKIISINNNAAISIKDSSNKTKDISNKLATGDTITVTVNNESKTYTVYVYGDVDGNASVSTVDYMRIVKHITNKSKLSGAYAEAADVNKDGKIDTLDYMRIVKYITGKISSI